MTTYTGSFYQFDTIIYKDAHLDYWSYADEKEKMENLMPDVYLQINIYRAQFT